MVLVMTCPPRPDSQDGHVVGLGAAAGEYDFARIAAEERRHLPPRLLQTLLGDLAEMMDTGRVAVCLGRDTAARPPALPETRGSSRCDRSRNTALILILAMAIITLTTDFGLSDHYVGVMKGVILGIAPAARIVDISHQSSAYEIGEGAFLIAQAYRYFPKKTVHVIVVDPGVGTARRPILAEAAGQYFVAPDNGVLGMIFRQEKHKVRVVTNARYFLKPVSQTFHGRDIFAPVGAHLAKGVAPARMGKLIQDYLRPALGAPERTGKHFWTGSVLKVDHFGNVVTNFRLSDIPEGPFELVLGPHVVTKLATQLCRVRAGRAVYDRGQFRLSGDSNRAGIGGEDTGLCGRRARGTTNLLTPLSDFT